MKTLKDIPENQFARITSLTESSTSERLMEMGFLRDQRVKVIRKAPFGDPLAVRVGNSTVMLRLSEADSVGVEME